MRDDAFVFCEIRKGDPKRGRLRFQGILNVPFCVPRLRKKAVFKWGNIGSSDATVFPALIEALRDSDARVRCEAILAVLKLDAEAKQAMPPLTDVQRHDRDPKVRRYAAKAVAKLREED